MKVWQQSDQTSERLMQKFLLEGLDTIVQADCDVLSRIKVGKQIATPVVRWVEEQSYPTGLYGQFTGTNLFTVSEAQTLMGLDFSLVGSTDAMIGEVLNQVLRSGTILERTSDGAQIKLGSCALIRDLATPFTAVAATYGNSPTTADTTDTYWEIISEVWSDYKDADESRSLTRTFREVGTQIHSETFEIPKTRKNTKYEIVADEVEHQIAELLDKMRRQLAYSCLRSRPYYATTYKYGNQVEESTMCGLTSWAAIIQGEAANADIYVNAATAEITKTMLDDLSKAMWLEENANFNRGTWVIICHPNVHKYIQDFDAQYRRKTEDSKRAGFYVDTIDVAIGKSLPVIADRYMRPDVLHIVNLDSLSYGYFANDKIDRKELATQGRYQRWLISFQTYGLVARKPRQNIGTIYGLAIA